MFVSVSQGFPENYALNWIFDAFLKVPIVLNPEITGTRWKVTALWSQYTHTMPSSKHTIVYFIITIHGYIANVRPIYTPQAVHPQFMFNSSTHNFQPKDNLESLHPMATEQLYIGPTISLTVVI